MSWGSCFVHAVGHAVGDHDGAVGWRATKMYSPLASWNGSPLAKPPWNASSSRPATSSRPSHSFFVAHHSELFPPGRRRCRPGCRRRRTGSCAGSVRRGARRRARQRVVVEGEAFQANRPPGRTTQRPARTDDGGPPTWTRAGGHGTDRRQEQPAHRRRDRPCRPRAGRAPRPPRPRAGPPACSSIAGEASTPTTRQTGRLRATGWPPSRSPIAQLDQRSIGGAGELDVEGDIGRRAGRPVLVALRERLVPAHRSTVRPAILHGTAGGPRRKYHTALIQRR